MILKYKEHEIDLLSLIDPGYSIETEERYDQDEEFPFWIIFGWEFDFTQLSGNDVFKFSSRDERDYVQKQIECFFDEQNKKVIELKPY